MATTRIPWLRGAAVIGVAGAVLAAALMSPVLAAKPARKAFVRAKVAQAVNAFRTEAQNTFIEDGLSYVRTTPRSVAAGTFADMSVACPVGQKVVGGGAAVGNLTTDDAELEASYPSHGATQAAGTTGWTASIENTGTLPFSASAYAICARASGAAEYTEGGAAARGQATTGLRRPGG